MMLYTEPVAIIWFIFISLDLGRRCVPKGLSLQNCNSIYGLPNPRLLIEKLRVTAKLQDAYIYMNNYLMLRCLHPMNKINLPFDLTKKTHDQPQKLNMMAKIWLYSSHG